ncbi:hypothetical protein LY76DRAFT_10198 [Colletotrichum caudatum]|nr:hypothetical protein LY76DRAFT_10198 [Colletotrichum caudatum]
MIDVDEIRDRNLSMLLRCLDGIHICYRNPAYWVRSKTTAPSLASATNRSRGTLLPRYVLRKSPLGPHVTNSMRPSAAPARCYAWQVSELRPSGAVQNTGGGGLGAIRCLANRARARHASCRRLVAKRRMLLAMDAGVVTALCNRRCKLSAVVDLEKARSCRLLRSQGLYMTYGDETEYDGRRRAVKIGEDRTLARRGGGGDDQRNHISEMEKNEPNRTGRREEWQTHKS